MDFALTGDWEGWRAAPCNWSYPRSRWRFSSSPRSRASPALDARRARSEFIRTARSLGLSRTRIVVTYALRKRDPAGADHRGHRLLDDAGGQRAGEKVFSWPGVASYALDALLSSDYAPVQGFVLLMAAIFVP